MDDSDEDVDRHDQSFRPSSTKPSSASLARTVSHTDHTTTLTSFEPFSSPRRVHDDSDDSHSSSKKSRSIYAPGRQNSVHGESKSDNNGQITSPDPQSKKTNSTAASSLMNAMMDDEDSESGLFNDHDLQYFRHRPSALANIDNKSLRDMSKSQSWFAMVRTLASDLAQRDAEMVVMRKRLEELSKIFKDHLCQEHDLSRMDADRTLDHITRASQHVGDHTLERGLEDAADSTVADSDTVRSDSQSSAALERDYSSAMPSELQSSRRGSASRSSQNGAGKGMLTMFGGRPTARTSSVSKPAPKKKEPPLPTQLNSAKATMYHKRKSSIGSNSGPKFSSATVGPVEMNAIVETEDLPPPLTSQRDIQIQYPGYAADVYGFIIDSTRINEFMDKNRLASPQPPTSKGADSPVTSASSVKSAPETDDEGEIPELEQQSWTNYLKLDGASFGSLSWLPIASTTSATPEEVESALDSPSEMAQPDAVKLLQTQLADDFARLQKSRLIPWEKFLNSTTPAAVAPEPSSPSFMPALFRRGGNLPAPNQASTTPDVPPHQAASLPPALRADRTRLVLSGIPMSLRSRIYTSIATEALQPDPDAYAALVAQSKTSVDASLLAEIEDDIPRTLPNNVFFRPAPTSSRTKPSAPSSSSSSSGPSKGRHALRELLLAFLARRPEIGYCQGMNLIAGYLLLISPTTESAFWVFTYLIERVLSDIYFDATLRGASIEICVLRSFVDELVPRLGRRLEQHGVEGRESAPYNWFLTAYASALGVEGVLRVWDVLLGLPQGAGTTGFLVRLGVGLCKAFEEELLGLEGGFEIRGFMDGMGVGGVKDWKKKEKKKKDNGKKKRDGGSSSSSSSRGIGIDGLVKAAWMLGGKIRDDEVRKRRRFFALRVDESAFA